MRTPMEIHLSLLSRSGSVQMLAMSHYVQIHHVRCPHASPHAVVQAPGRTEVTHNLQPPPERYRTASLKGNRTSPLSPHRALGIVLL